MSELIVRYPYRFALLVIWACYVYFADGSVVLVEIYAGFSLLGIFGAIFANSTGAGGGVIFIPFFNQLGMSEMSSVATSFAIQCVGMSAGAVSWLSFVRATPELQHPQFRTVLMVTGPLSIVGILAVQFFDLIAPGNLHQAFGLFSLLLALAIFASVFVVTSKAPFLLLTRIDFFALSLIALIGGGITAWLSVGVGELLAVYLIIRGYNIVSSIAIAVIVTAFSVWSAIPYHIWESQAIEFNVWLFAAAGALIGGTLARYVVSWISPRYLKLFFAFWIAFMGWATL